MKRVSISGIAAKLLKELVSGRKKSATVCPYKNVTCSLEHTAKAAIRQELQEIKSCKKSRGTCLFNVPKKTSYSTHHYW